MRLVSFFSYHKPPNISLGRNHTSLTVRIINVDWVMEDYDVGTCYRKEITID